MDRRSEILQFISDYHQAHGYAPTVREIARGVDLVSNSSVTHHLKALVASGLIVRDERVSRSIRVVKP